jgi:elongation factor 3
MWQNPHLLVLDEPTNYLDRDGLGALTLALKEWTGGVIIISHNKEFCNAVATEKWIMQNGRLRQEGASVREEEETTLKGEKEDVFDQFGNKLDTTDVDKSAKEAKKELKGLEKQLKDNKKKKILSQQEVWEIEDRIAVLKEKLGKETPA